MKVMKKLLILFILLTTVMSCELFDAKTWDEADERWEEKGMKCYRRNGYFYCKDKYGNYL